MQARIIAGADSGRDRGQTDERNTKPMLRRIKPEGADSGENAAGSQIELERDHSGGSVVNGEIKREPRGRARSGSNAGRATAPRVGFAKARAMAQGVSPMRKLLQFGAGMLVLGTGVANAAVPTGVDTAYNAILTDATTLSGYAAPVVIGVLGLVIVFKLIKRFANKI